MTVTFVHESGVPAYHVPGYFAADGEAANSSASAGDKWRAHLSPDKSGRWDWRISFVSGPDVAVNASSAGNAIRLAPFDGLSGSFRIFPSDKSAPDFRARGRLQYVGRHHLRFAGTGDYFLKIRHAAREQCCTRCDQHRERDLRHAEARRRGDASRASCRWRAARSTLDCGRTTEYTRWSSQDLRRRLPSGSHAVRGAQHAATNHALDGGVPGDDDGRSPRQE